MVNVRTRVKKQQGVKQNEVSVAVRFHVVEPETSVAELDETELYVIGGPCSPTRLRLAAAKHFLDLLEKHHTHQVLVTFYFDAFCSAARSVTWVLQNEARGLPEFEAWYETWQNKLRTDVLASFFLQLRNQSEKEHPHTPAVTFECDILHRLDGTVETGSHRIRLSLDGHTLAENVIDTSRQYLQRLTELVQAAHKKGYTQPPAQELPRFNPRYLRQTPKGGWLPFDPPHWEPHLNEFPSRKDYDKWKRGVKTATGKWQ